MYENIDNEMKLDKNKTLSIFREPEIRNTNG